MSDKSNLLKPYRGTRDYYPKDFKKLSYIFSIWREACKAFGYEEYLGPLVEYKTLYTQKQASGDEISNKQLYWFVDQGGREIAIRPEMTPTVSRMVGAKIESLPKPVRWFSIANFMRYERPQKGRSREFFQLNVDSFGVHSNLVDAELVELAIFIMDLFGATEEMYEIRLNNRKWFNYYVREVLGVEGNLQPISRIIDNIEKFSKDENRQKLKDLSLDENAVGALLNIASQTLDDVRKFKDRSEGAKELIELMDLLNARGYDNVIRYDGSLVRGFDYYTGNVFEQFDKHKDNNRSMFGGGRYDNLVGLYSGKDVPASGLAPGGDTTQLFLNNWNLWPENVSSTDVLVTVAGKEYIEDSWELASALRDIGLNVETYMGESFKLSKQLDYANKKNIAMVAILGQEEVEKGAFIWKNMKSGEQQEVLLEDLIKDLLVEEEHAHKD